jgi:hypothetical protein
MRNCALCLKRTPHFDIIVENGRVTEVWYISTKDYWNRALEQDAYTVLYNTSVEQTEPVIRRVLHAVKQKLFAFRQKPTDTWLTPKVYKGKSMHEEELSQEEKDWLNKKYE